MACRRRQKERLIEEFGGRCQRCGYNRCIAALEFHHIDPKTKEFGIAQKGRTNSYEKALAEAKKCVLLCANCHREVEALQGARAVIGLTVNQEAVGSNPTLAAHDPVLLVGATVCKTGGAGFDSQSHLS
jgi:uncharacterized protein YbjQ (UPF0145 family)